MATEFTIIRLKQGSDAWLKWRHNGIGGSDASTIMGENRFKSVGELLIEKQGPMRSIPPNAAMARGTALEPAARRLYVATTGKDVSPICLQSTRYEWLRVSLDGLTKKRDGVVEIKCGRSAFRVASQTNRVPAYYFGQLQHIMAITGLPSVDFWCYWPAYDPILITVPRNDDYIRRLIQTELEFWKSVQRNTSKKAPHAKKNDILIQDYCVKSCSKSGNTSAHENTPSRNLPTETKPSAGHLKKKAESRPVRPIRNKLGREMSEWELNRLNGLNKPVVETPEFLDSPEKHTSVLRRILNSSAWPWIIIIACFGCYRLAQRKAVLSNLEAQLAKLPKSGRSTEIANFEREFRSPQDTFNTTIKLEDLLIPEDKPRSLDTSKLGGEDLDFKRLVSETKPTTFSQDLAASYGFVVGQHFTLSYIKEQFPELAGKVFVAETVWNTVFGTAEQELELKLQEIYGVKWHTATEELTTRLSNLTKDASLSELEATRHLADVVSRAKGKTDFIGRQLLLGCKPTYSNNPVMELVDGWREKFSTEGHPKANHLTLQIKFPQSWYREEGDRPHIVQKWKSKFGHGQEHGLLGIMPLPSVSQTEIKDLFTEEGLKEFLPERAVYLESRQSKIEQQPLGEIHFKLQTKRLDKEMQTRSVMFVIVFNNILISIIFGCEIDADGNSSFEKMEPLFKAILNSLVLENKWKS